jgi:hypothetical protein
MISALTWAKAEVLINKITSGMIFIYIIEEALAKPF